MAEPREQPVRRRTAEERRDEVIRAAILEFATYGLYGGSTERIAVLAGISQPYVLRLFGTKKALFLAALDRVAEQILQAWSRSIGDLERRLGAPGTPEQRLEAMGLSYEEIVREVLPLRLLLQGFSASEDADVRAQSQAWMKRVFDWVRKATGADAEQVRIFFAQGMMLTVAASIAASDKVESDEWARAMLMLPIDR